MRVQDDGRVRGDTRNDAEADPSGERQASTVRYVPVMTSEQLAASQTAFRSARREGGRPGLMAVLHRARCPGVCSNRSVSRARPTAAA